MVSSFHRESEQGNIWFEPFLLCKASLLWATPPPQADIGLDHMLLTAQDIWMPKIVSMRVLEQGPSHQTWDFLCRREDLRKLSSFPWERGSLHLVLDIKGSCALPPQLNPRKAVPGESWRSRMAGPFGKGYDCWACRSGWGADLKAVDEFLVVQWIKIHLPV